MMKHTPQHERIEFYFPQRVSKLLRELIPARERSRFVVEATEKELRRRLFHDRLKAFSKVDADSYRTGSKPAWKKLGPVKQ